MIPALLRSSRCYLTTVSAGATGWLAPSGGERRGTAKQSSRAGARGIILLLALPLPYVPPALVIAATLLCDVLTLAFSVALTFPFVPANESVHAAKKEGRVQASP